MESHVRNNLWHLLRAHSAEAQQARRRLGVGIACAVFLGGLLTAVGLAIVVFALSLSVVLIVAVMSAWRAVHRHRNELQHFGHTLVRSVTRAVRHLHARGRQVLSAAVTQLSGLRNSTGRRIAASAAKARQAVRPPSPRASSIDLQREALRLNAAGTKRRRDGAPAEAIPLHTRALEILRDAHDPHATALVQNNLALALSHAGDDRRATTLFEQAAATVRELGDPEQEGRIIANLAVAHRRHGRVDECDHTLRLALTKLRRDSSAYRRVAAELTRAGGHD
jgi:tetratricopeptide (TPR) repeat protein